MSTDEKTKEYSGAGSSIANNFNAIEPIVRWIEKNERLLFYIIIALSGLTALLLFDIKPTLEGDDADYILRAFYLIKEGVYPGYQGPLYPAVLSLPVALFGLNLIALKLLSVLFSLGHIYFMYLAFRKRTPYIILFIVLLFIATNCYIQYYSSQTFTEAFFFFIQAFALWTFFKLIDQLPEGMTNLSRIWRSWTLAGFSLFLLSITKNVGIVSVLALITYFIFTKRFLEVLYSIGAFLIFKIPYELLTRTLFNVRTSSQFNSIFLKDSYNSGAGKEDAFGMIIRFIENFYSYISKHTLVVLNLRPESAAYSIPLISFLMLGIFTAGMIAAFKYNKYIFFTGIYIFAIAGASFAALQSYWDQQRIIIILVPLILLCIVNGLILFARFWKPLGEITLALCFIILALNLKNTFGKISENIPVLQKNLSGDIYYGFPPAWINFMKLSKWCSENIEDSDLAASRKPSMSSLYGGGKKFYGIYSLLSDDPDTLYNMLKKNGVTHLLAASLSSNPDAAESGAITAVHETAFIIMQKYPDRLETIKIIGDTEPAYLIKLK